MKKRNRNYVLAPVADGLKRALFRTGYTNSELAEKAGLSRYTIIKALNGREVPPKTVKKLADALDVDPLDLVAL